jgi:hypothetical protein
MHLRPLILGSRRSHINGMHNAIVRCQTTAQNLHMGLIIPNVRHAIFNRKFERGAGCRRTLGVERNGAE